MAVRRVATGQDAAGKSRFVSDEMVEGAKVEGVFEIQVLWAEDAMPSLPSAGQAAARTSYYPPAGGHRFSICTLPPQGEGQASAARLGAEGIAAAMVEVERHAGDGLFAATERDHPGMHTTDTIDYGVVLSGEVWLELDDAEEVLLKPGDTFVQNGTRHRWNNRGSTPMTMAVVLIGGPRSERPA